MLVDKLNGLGGDIFHSASFAYSNGKKNINIHEDKSTNIIGGGITISTVITYHLLSTYRQSGKLTQSGKLGLATFALCGHIKERHRSSLLTYTYLYAH